MRLDGSHHQRRLESLRRRLIRHVAMKRTERLDGYVRAEREDLLAAIFDLTGRAVDVGRIEGSLAATNRLDFDILMTLLDRLGELPLQDWVFTWANGRECNPVSILEELRAVLTATQEVSEQARLLEVLLRLEMVADRQVEDILSAIPSDQGAEFKQWLVGAVETKLGVLDDQETMKSWGRLKAEFERHEDDETCMRPVPGILDASFFDLKTPAEARRKIATYLVTIRPQLIRALEAQGQTRFPMTMFGVTRILAITENGAPLERADSTFATALMRLAVLWTSVLREDPKVLRGHLRLQEHEGRLTQGPFYEEEAERLTDLGTDEWTIVLGEEGEKILDRIEELATARTPAEELLVRHKLALEVMAPANLSEVSAKNEIRLQQELCRFMIEHGVFSVGTQFGRSETDLVAREAAGALVIETKIAKRGPSTSMIRAWLVQLQSYMDQEPVQVNGVLLIYNLSDSLIVAPRQRLRDRYRIVVVNLLKPSPSKRQRSIEIIESESDSLIEVLVEDGRPATRRKKATKRKTTRGRPQR